MTESNLKSPSTQTLEYLQAPKRMLIANNWREAVAGGTLDVYDPATQARLCSVPAADARDVDSAIAAARTALHSRAWAGARSVDRERWLLRLADLIEQHANQLAEIETLDNGMPLAFARHLYLPQCVDAVRYAAGWATKLTGSTVDATNPAARRSRFFAYTVREPVGVVGAIVPWNFPLLGALWKIAPALAAGCTVILKPSEETPLSALRLAELSHEAGFPKGVFNVITGDGQTAGAALVAHPGVDKIVFTGSTAVGKSIQRACAENLTRTSLELGGKCPMIILDDADAVSAAAVAARAAVFNSGQACVAASRLYVQRALFDEVVERVAGVFQALRIGSGFDKQAQLGPLVSARHLARVTQFVAGGVDEGARLLCGGSPLDCAGHFLKPAIFVDVPSNARIAQEEIFGPVLVCAAFDTLDEAATLANSSSYGLGASIISNDIRRIHSLVPNLRSGTVWVNCHGVLDNALPFGGSKQSGIGRELGDALASTYTETKSIMMQIDS